VAGHAFISYSREDQEYVDQLVTLLRDRGAEVWLDRETDYGARWANVVEQQVRSAAVVIVVMTPASEASVWVEREVLVAEQKAMVILPLLLSGKRWFRLLNYHDEDVTSAALPTDRFVARVVDLAPAQSARAPTTGATTTEPGPSAQNERPLKESTRTTRQRDDPSRMVDLAEWTVPTGATLRLGPYRLERADESPDSQGALVLWPQPSKRRDEALIVEFVRIRRISRIYSRPSEGRFSVVIELAQPVVMYLKFAGAFDILEEMRARWHAWRDRGQVN
jgi:hypothetical protein